MYLKLTDRDGRGFRLVETRSVTFRRHPEAMAICDQDGPTPQTFALGANAYILNDQGKTIETFIVPNGDRKS